MVIPECTSVAGPQISKSPRAHKALSISLAVHVITIGITTKNTFQRIKMVLQLITLLQRQPTYTVASYMHSNSVLNTCIPNISLLSRVSSLHCCIGIHLGHIPGADLLGAILIMVLSRHVPGTRPRSTTSTTKANCVKFLCNS